MGEQKIHVLIVDDQRLMREGLRIILEDTPDIEVIGEAENGLIAIQNAENLHPDVILDGYSHASARWHRSNRAYSEAN